MSEVLRKTNRKFLEEITAAIISVATLKGGAAKTTSAVSLSSILAEQGKKVLFIDIDPQANGTSNLGVDEFNELDNQEGEELELKENFVSAIQLYENPNCNAKDIIVKTPIEELPTLDIIPGSLLLTATELKLNSKTGREFILRNFFKRNAAVFNQYDYIIFDTNPYMSIVNQNAYVISDAIILTTNCSMNSLRGLKLFKVLWKEIREVFDLPDNIKGILITKFNKVPKLQRDFIDYIKNNDRYKDLLFKTIIPIHAKMEDAETASQPINLYDKNGKSNAAYTEFTKELLNRLNN